MKLENVTSFQQKFEDVVNTLIKPEMLQQEVLIELTIPLTEITSRFFKILKQFEPFGPQNDAPIFLTKKVVVIGNAYLVGTNHIKMTIRQEDSAAFECIGFGLAEHIAHINSGKPFDICYVIEENNWRGKKNLQLNIKAIRY